MKLLKIILPIVILEFLTIQCFGTTWAAAYPYTQKIDGQNIVIKAYSYSPYYGSPTIGITKVYSNNRLLYSIDRYYRENIFTSQDGQYLAVVNTIISSRLMGSIFFVGSQIDFNETAIEVFKNGLPFKTYSLKDIIDTTRFTNDDNIFCNYLVQCINTVNQC